MELDEFNMEDAELEKGRRGGRPGPRPGWPTRPRPPGRPRRPGRGPFSSWVGGVGQILDPGSAEPADWAQPRLTAGTEPSTGDCGDAVVLDGFEDGDYRLRSHHYEPLDRLLKQVLSVTPRSSIMVKIEGYSDNTGTPAANKGLSFSRAIEVGRFITSFAVDVRVRVSGFGSGRPAASNATESGRRKNRRVELRLCRLSSAS